MTLGGSRRTTAVLGPPCSSPRGRDHPRPGQDGAELGTGVGAELAEPTRLVVPSRPTATAPP